MNLLANIKTTYFVSVCVWRVQLNMRNIVRKLGLVINSLQDNYKQK